MNTKKHPPVETWLPVFPGFYGTVLTPEPEKFDIENELNETLTKADYILPAILESDKARKPIELERGQIFAECYGNSDTESFEEYMAEVGAKSTGIIYDLYLKPFFYNLDFERINSPREYNFHNDAVYIVAYPKKSKIKKYIYQNFGAFSEYLEVNYTGSSGFIPHYSNDVEDWKEETKSFSDFTSKDGQHMLGAVMQFICEQEAEKMDFAEGNVYEQYLSELFETGILRSEIRFSEQFLAQLTPGIEAIKQYAKDNYTSIPTDDYSTPAELNQYADILNVGLIIQDTVKEIDNKTLSLL